MIGVDAPFIGRERELGRLDAAWQAARAGSPRTVLVGGEAGIGKSTLVGHVVARAVEEGAFAAAGGSPPGGAGELPFAAIVQLLRAVGRGLSQEETAAVIGPAGPVLSRLVPTLASGDGMDADGGSRMALFEAVLGSLERLADARGPVVLVIEDLHWADRSTRELLAYLVHSLRDVRVLILVTYRTDDLPPGHPLRIQLAELDRSPRVDRLELARLRRDEVRAQLTALLASPPSEAAARRVVDLSDGNPYVVEELARAMAEGRDDVPDTLRELLQSRLGGLPPAIDQLLRVCAVAGPRFDQRVLTAVATITPAELGALLRDAVARGLLVLDREGEREVISFRQTLVGQIVYDGLIGPERQQLHAAIARALEGDRGLVAGPPALVEGAIARHWLLAGAARQARDALLRAGIAAEQAWAFPEAAVAYRYALDLWDPADQAPVDDNDDGGRPIGFRAARAASPARTTPIDRTEAARRAAEASSLAGQPDQAVELIGTLLGSGGNPSAAADWLRLGRYAGEAGDLARSLAAYDRAAALAGDDLRLSARVATARAGAFVTAGRYREARAAATAAITAARAAHSTSIERTARQVHGVALAMEGEVDAGLAELAGARDLASAPANASVVAPRPSQIADVVRGVEGYARVLARANRPTEVAMAALEGAELARRYGVEDTLGARVAATGARTALQRGDWPAVDRETGSLLERTPDPDAITRAHTLRAQLATMRGATDTALAEIAAAMQASARCPDELVLADLAVARADLAAWRGRHQEAREVVAAAIQGLQATEDRAAVLPLAWVGLRVEADRAELARARRNPHEVAECLEVGTALRAEVLALAMRLGDRAGEMPREVRAMSALADGEWARLEGRPDAPAWEAAVRRSADVRDPWLEAYALWREAEARLAGRDGRNRAERAVRTALDRVAALGGSVLGEELLALARRGRLDVAPGLDLRPAPTAPDPRETLGLTQRELEVLALIAEGYTNRRIAETLFITEKTAGHHVSNLLGKLGVSSRVEAAALAHRLGLAASA